MVTKYYLTIYVVNANLTINLDEHLKMTSSFYIFIQL